MSTSAAFSADIVEEVSLVGLMHGLGSGGIVEVRLYSRTPDQGKEEVVNPETLISTSKKECSIKLDQNLTNELTKDMKSTNISSPIRDAEFLFGMVFVNSSGRNIYPIFMGQPNGSDKTVGALLNGAEVQISGEILSWVRARLGDSSCRR